MRKYEIIETWRGYEIRYQYGKNKYMYLEKVYRGCFHWISDFTYAKHYTLKTVEKHIRTLEEKERI